MLVHWFKKLYSSWYWCTCILWYRMSVQFISGACLMVVSIYISEAISPILIGNHSKLCSFVLLSNSTTSFLFIVYFTCGLQCPEWRVRNCTSGTTGARILRARGKECGWEEICVLVLPRRWKICRKIYAQQRGRSVHDYWYYFILFCRAGSARMLPRHACIESYMHSCQTESTHFRARACIHNAIGALGAHYAIYIEPAFWTLYWSIYWQFLKHFIVERLETHKNNRAISLEFKLLPLVFC